MTEEWPAVRAAWRAGRTVWLFQVAAILALGVALLPESPGWAVGSILGITALSAWLVAKRVREGAP